MIGELPLLFWGACVVVTAVASSFFALTDGLTSFIKQETETGVVKLTDALMPTPCWGDNLNRYPGSMRVSIDTSDDALKLTY
ncbi:hypothetical protein AU253_07930 [Yersinia pestis]|nr:hypothetical protein AU253_07930 [Yersinia pestis]